MKTYLVFILSLIILLSFSGVAVAETITLNNPLCSNGAGPNCINDFPALIAAITTFVSTAVGVLAVLVFLYAGILFITSAGDPGKIEKAKEALKWAVIGVVIAFAGNGLVAVVRAVIGTAPT